MTSKPAKLIVVLGMHRSGTSLLAEALHAGGFGVAENLLDTEPAINSRGFWEDADVVAINETILESLACHWHSLNQLPGNWLERSEIKSLQQEAKALLQKNYCQQAMLVKDPRMTRLWAFWQELFADLGIEVYPLLLLREPLAVAHSLQSRNGLSLDYGLLLWARYLADLGNSLTGQSWSALDYDDLLADPAGQIGAALEQLGIDQELDTAAITAVADPALRHHHKDCSGAFDAELLASCQSLKETLHSGATQPLPGHPILEDAKLCAILSDLATELIDKYSQQVEIGSQHSHAQETVASRDRQLATANAELSRLGQLYAEAEAVVSERDAQLQELNERLSKAGKELEHAQQVVQTRDIQLAELQALIDYMNNNPLARLFLRRARKKTPNS